MADHRCHVLDIEGGASIHVYQLQNAIAEEVAKVVNDAPSGPRALPENGIRRSDWNKLDHAERHRLIRGGGIIVD